MTWLFGQLFILFVCIAYVQHVYFTNILPDKMAKESFLQTSCFLISKKLADKGHLVHRYRADFLVSYHVNGVQYNRWVSGNGLDRSYSKTSAGKEDLLAQYDVGKSYPCWYDPDSPQSIVMVMRRDWFSILPIIVPLAVGVLTLYYCLKSFFHVIDSLIVRSRKRQK